jgi:hypothetical protein
MNKTRGFDLRAVGGRREGGVAAIRVTDGRWSSNRHFDHRRHDLADANCFGRFGLDPKIVPAGSEAGKVHERLERVGLELPHGLALPADTYAR